MTATHPPAFRRRLADGIELLGSMRFAVSLLMFICVASVIGTVLAQNRPASNYIDQFGPFWFELFDKFSIWHVYNSWWFLLIMAFLVVSTSVCLMRNTPKMLQDARSFREYVRASSLRAFPHRAQADTGLDVPATVQRLRQLLARQGYAVRERRDGDSVMLAAKRGSGNRLGYIFAHASIVIICVGGLFDSELPVRMQVWLGGKQPLTENMLIADVPASGRLSADNPSFRANVLVPEQGRISNAVVLVGDGALVQPLPFTLTLKKFIVDYYSTGMPSRFASEVQVTDPEDGRTFDATIEVNEPLRYKGVTVYQSSFDDGGSRVVLTGRPLSGPRDFSFEVDGKVGQSSPVSLGDTGQALQLDITGLRPINVEDLRSGEPPQPKALREHVAAVTGSAAGTANEHLRNVGPSIEYRLLDASGQAHEFHNYMLPVQLDEIPVFLAGVRETPAENYRYLRIPADEQGKPDEFLALRAALADPAQRREAAERFARANVGGADGQALQDSAQRALDTFSETGLQGVARFLEANVAPEELPRAADIVIRLLGAAMGELRAMVRERMGLAPLPQQGEAAVLADAWSRMAVAALSDLALYPVPVLFTLSDFEHVQASVFQVSRTPGKNAVYFGCLLLVLGIFTMFYVRDRRIWMWVSPKDGGSHVVAAMTSQKRTLDFNREFERLRQALGRLA
ncbi:cytochrome c biogenesis protein ResB [Orrella sp. JC864]|uniref:cytochrome c biogenesis protein ResB n=1 Tax=Orrella sp. JC864 TaxID=3120298 RepID=UPI00300A9B4E